MAVIEDTLIIEEQKKQVGTVKALGFRNGKIRSKYLLFGVSAAAVGSLLGIGLSVLLEKAVLDRLKPRYSFAELPVMVSVPAAVSFCGVTLLVYEFPEFIQPVALYSKSLYSEDLINRFGELFAGFIGKLTAADYPEKISIHDLI